MAIFKCPDCKKKISLDAQTCPNCGRVVTEQDRIDNTPKPTPLWRKILNLIIICIILFGIGKCYWSDKQETRAFNREMSPVIAEIIELNANNLGLIKKYGHPTYEVDYSGLGPTIWVDFQIGPMTKNQAAIYSKKVCQALAIAFAARKKPATTIRVRVRTPAKGATDKDLVNIYGVATYQSSNDSITWEPEK